jgi:Type II secretion system (T2SS), protein M subtype b
MDPFLAAYCTKEFRGLIMRRSLIVLRNPLNRTGIALSVLLLISTIGCLISCLRWVDVNSRCKASVHAQKQIAADYRRTRVLSRYIHPFKNKGDQMMESDLMQMIDHTLNRLNLTSSVREFSPVETQEHENVTRMEIKLRLSPVSLTHLDRLLQELESGPPAVFIHRIDLERTGPGQTLLNADLILHMTSIRLSDLDDSGRNIVPEHTPDEP